MMKSQQVLRDCALALALAFAMLLGSVVLTGTGNAANNGNGANHGANPAQGGTSANPNGVGDGGGGIHNIQGIKDRQGRQGGTPPACTAHGGLAAKNKNC